MTDVETLLALQQISDSAFPSGIFTHSLGLEQLARERVVSTLEEVERFVASTLVTSTTTSDAVATAQSARCASAGDLGGIIEIDRELFSMKAARELRNAATETGRRLLEEVEEHIADPLLAALREEVRAGRTPGAYPVVFGAIAARLGADTETAAALVLQGTANAILQAAMRILPISHRDVQGALHRLRPRLAELAREAADPKRALESFHPLQDIASMQHEAAPVRMFRS
jgi:urease accessory protein